ncbi:MAG: hypothetical protein LBC74_12910 [Planctomycetaceae bacterium]|jgi:hypothetical protein|nr:hypothetical protein [Planctomycetaceae bacterium]
MRDIDEGTIRRIDWQELLPPVLLFRLFNVAIGGRVLFFAIIGIFLTIVVNLLLYPFVSQTAPTFAEITDKAVVREKGFSILIDRINNRNDNSRSKIMPPDVAGKYGNIRGDIAKLNDKVILNFVVYISNEVKDSVLFVWYFFTRSGGQFFMLEHDNLAKCGAGLLGFMATVIVWGFTGGLICRSTAMRLTRDKSESIRDLFRFLWSRGFSFLSSILIVTIGILVCILLGMIPPQIAGYLNWTPVNYFVTIIFPFTFLFNFFALLLLVGLWFGFPLLFAAVATDGADGFDAVSRTFSYLFQRPFHYVLYWFLAAFQGFLGYFVIVFLVTGTIILTEHFSGQNGLSLFAINSNSNSNFTNISTGWLLLLSAWFDLLRFLVVAYLFTWFWTSGVAIYLLLRRSVDASPFTEVYCQNPVKTRTLPKIKIDSQGVPEFDKNKTE